MIAKALGFFGSPLGLKLLAGVAAAALVGGVLLHYYRKGKAAGQEEQKQQSAQDIKTTKDVAQANAEAQVAEAKAREDKARADSEQSNARAEMFRQQALGYAGQLAGIRERVRAVPEAELHPRNVATLGLRQPGEAAACYTGMEERVIAGCLEQQPVAEKRAAALEANVAELTKAVTAQGLEIRAVGDQLAARNRQVAAYDLAFTQLYNLHPPEYRRWTCAWAWRCGKRKLPVPSPAEMRQAAAAPARP